MTFLSPSSLRVGHSISVEDTSNSSRARVANNIAPVTYLPDLTPCDIFLFPRTKSQLWRRCSHDVVEFQEQSTAIPVSSIDATSSSRRVELVPWIRKRTTATNKGKGYTSLSTQRGNFVYAFILCLFNFNNNESSYLNVLLSRYFST